MAKCDGVADATVVGGASRAIQVRIDTNKLRAYGLSLANVQTALTNQNVASPGGPIRTSVQVFNTRTQALIAAGIGVLLFSLGIVRARLALAFAGPAALHGIF